MEVGSHLHRPSVIKGAKNHCGRSAKIFKGITLADSHLAWLAHSYEQIGYLDSGIGIAAGDPIARINCHISPGDLLVRIQRQHFVVSFSLTFECARMSFGVAFIDFDRGTV